MEQKKCGFIAIIGRPNVGKSTLTNALIGAKLSIVSRKSQTTRHRIHGVLTQDDTQFVFVDTPGFQTRHGGTLNQMMNRVVKQTLADIDVVLHVVEAGKWSAGDENIISLLNQKNKNILVLSKIDLLKNKNEMFDFVNQIMRKFNYDAVVPVSSVKGIQLDNLLHEITEHLPEGEFIFDEDAFTDRSIRFLSTEIIREKVFRLVGDELPYSSTVIIDLWEEQENGVHISASIIVERENHRPILLGKGGLHMKRIATEARQEIAELIDKPVFLEVFIKVRKGWADKESSLRQLGYE